jgi:hypothetical protein
MVALLLQQAVLQGRSHNIFSTGVQDPAYWASWAISHWSTMAVSGALCALVGTYPFSHSSATLLLAFYWLVAAVRSSHIRLASLSSICRTWRAVLDVTRHC